MALGMRSSLNAFAAVSAGSRSRRASSVCRLRHDQMEQGPTEPHAGRSTFLLSSGGAVAGITERRLRRDRFLLRTSFLAGR